MRKLGILSLMVLVMSLTVVTGSYAATIHVPADYGTITAAITAASSGDTILVAAGTYSEWVWVIKSLTIKGHSAADTFVKAPTSSSSVFWISANNVTLSGFNISGATDSGYAGIVISPWFFSWVNYNNITVQKCTVEHNSGGIVVYRSSNVKIMNNIVRNTIMRSTDTDEQGVGIAVLSDNTFSVTNTTISGNSIYDNDWWGIMVGRTLATGAGTPNFSGLVIKSNSIYNNGSLDLSGGLGDVNWNGLGFYNCSGPITLTSNKILETDGGFFQMFTIGVAAGQITGTGNKVYHNLKPAKLTGPNEPLPGY
jgi:parallel beta-helix repeat protein